MHFLTQLEQFSLNTVQEAGDPHIHGSLNRPIARKRYLMYVPTVLVPMPHKRSNHKWEKDSTNEQADPLGLVQLHC